MKETLKDKIKSFIGFYGGNINKYVNESTLEIFNGVKNNTNSIKGISIKDLLIGKFYIIKYNYDGNFIYCPIFTIEYRVVNNKNILYCINLDYLPYMYKAKFFSLIVSKFITEWDKNKDIESVENELPFRGINFEIIYKLLKNGGSYDYSITAFDILKIKEVYAISTNLLPRFLFIHTRKINMENIKEKVKISDNDIDREKLSKILNEFIKIDSSYKEDIQEFYKKLKALESNYKLLK